MATRSRCRSSVRSWCAPARRPTGSRQLSDALAKVAASPEYKAFLKDQYGFDDSFEGANTASAYVQTQLDDMKKAMATN